jgi:hypothetical protein
VLAAETAELGTIAVRVSFARRALARHVSCDANVTYIKRASSRDDVGDSRGYRCGSSRLSTVRSLGKFCSGAPLHARSRSHTRSRFELLEFAQFVALGKRRKREPMARSRQSCESRRPVVVERARPPRVGGSPTYSEPSYLRNTSSWIATTLMTSVMTPVRTRPWTSSRGARLTWSTSVSSGLDVPGTRSRAR